MEDPIVKAAQLAFSIRLKDSSDVSDNTKNAQVLSLRKVPTMLSKHQPMPSIRFSKRSLLNVVFHAPIICLVNTLNLALSEDRGSAAQPSIDDEGTPLTLM
jgi:hypothetical protein